MNKKHNRLIATARQYALVTFLGLGMSFAVVNAAVKTNKIASVEMQEWVLNNSSAPTSPSSYSLNTGASLATQCEGDSQVCGIKAPANGNEPLLSPEHKSRISGLNTSSGDVFLQD